MLAASRLVLITLLFMAPFTGFTAANGNSIAPHYISMARQGDISQALSLFQSLKDKPGSSLDATLAEHYLHRFVLQDEVRPPPSDIPFINQLVDLFEAYWTRSLTGELLASDSKTLLNSELRDLLEKYNYINDSSESQPVFESLDRAISSIGLFYDRSVAAPWQDLIIWQKQQGQNRVITLTDQQVEAELVLMDEFITLGWTDFATLGMTSSGGWAKDKSIYCVSWAWNLESESFDVSFLRHEGRHLADFEAYPELGVPDLEYRAKLEELAAADSTLDRLLNNFTVNRGTDRDSPHAFASYHVVNDLYRHLYSKPFPGNSGAWARAKPAEVNAAAAELLQEHSRKLDAAGPLITTTVLP